jgi:hypothetical protein
MKPTISAMMIAGTHSGTCSGATRVKEKRATSASSTVMIGTSEATSAAAGGVVCGAARRNDPIRTAIPTDPLTMLATHPAAAERNMSRRPAVPPAARTQITQASVRASTAPS